jgi:hypothetical protein
MITVHVDQAKNTKNTAVSTEHATINGRSRLATNWQEHSRCGLSIEHVCAERQWFNRETLFPVNRVFLFGEQIRVSLFCRLHCRRTPSFPAFSGHVIDVRPYGRKEGIFGTFPAY